MAYGNNRAGEQPRAHFRKAGGSIIKFRHPYFAGAIETGTKLAVDEIDISKCCKLNGRFFEATPAQDSAKQEVMIDGSTVTITNNLLNGVMTIPAVPTTGLVATGDFIAGCQLIRSLGDDIGGLITKTDFVDGKALTKVYYGVTVKTCPDDVSEGNDVSVYNVQLFYAGWILAESAGDSELNQKAIWAVGSKKGIKGLYSPYSIQNMDGKGGTGSEMLSLDATNPNGEIADSVESSEDNSEEVNNVLADDGAFQKSGIVTNATTLEQKESGD